MLKLMKTFDDMMSRIVYNHVSAPTLLTTLMGHSIVVSLSINYGHRRNIFQKEHETVFVYFTVQTNIKKLMKVKLFET